MHHSFFYFYLTNAARGLRFYPISIYSHQKSIIMKKKSLILLCIVGCVFAGKAQVIGTGYSTNLGTNGFNSALQSGIYTSGDPQSGFLEYSSYPWKYLFVMRHNYSPYNQAFQLATNFMGEDRVFFRKMNEFPGGGNTPWYELATRGTNTFDGWQTINGSVLIPGYGGFHIGNTGNSGDRMRLSLNNYALFFDYYPRLHIRTGTGGPELEVMTMLSNGNVGIGHTNPGTKLDVAGTIRAHEVKVCLSQGCDYVFADDYDLMNLSDLNTFIKTNKHLPDVAPAAQMEAEGINLSEMNALLLKKVEELTLYVIELKNEIDKLKK